MKLEVQKSRPAGRITVPGSKSHTIRGISAGLMADGDAVLHGALDSADTRSALNAIRLLGAETRIAADAWSIGGTGGALKNPGSVLDLGNSGTALRLLTALAATTDFPVFFDGDDSLRTRLMKGLLSALTQLGARTDSLTGGRCPLSVQGPLRGGIAQVDGTTSQFFSALLMAAPFAHYDCEFQLNFLNEKPYVDITTRWLDRLGIEYTLSPDYLNARVPAGQRIPSFEAVIPADFSTAAFPLAAGVVCGGGITIGKLDFNDPQGDKAVFNLLQEIGARYRQEPDGLYIEPDRQLVGGEFDLNAIPDTLPVMAAVAATLPGESTRLYNVPQARFKETDRIQCMATELRKLGAEVVELRDGLIVTGAELKGAEVDGHADHRIVMALAVAGCAADGVTTIRGAEAAAVTYPDFIADFIRLGADFRLVEE